MRALLHLLSLFIPVSVLVWLAVTPAGGFGLVVAASIVVVPIVLDALAPPERAPPDETVPSSVWDGLLWVLFVLHLAAIAALPFYVSATGLGLYAVAAVVLVGNASAQGIVVAHELVHRPNRPLRLAGRILLGAVLYEHFFTEHLRGHHRRVATASDPATARYGERFWPFFFRTVPAQFKSAWALESKRLRAGGLFDPKQRYNRVLHGVVGGWAAAALILAMFGPLALGAHLGQALFAVVMLEGVNFIEHWGLRRAQKRVQVVDSWDSESALTYYMLIGLARHGDHHAHAARPYQDLRTFAETPKMPWGYLATTYCAVVADFWLLPKLDAELEARGLGPYADAAERAA